MRAAGKVPNALLAMDADLLTKSAIDIYRSLDTNGDGTLDKEEVRTSLAKFGYSDEEADKIMNALDKGALRCCPSAEAVCGIYAELEKFNLPSNSRLWAVP